MIDDWMIADSLSDRIVDLVNEELAAMRGQNRVDGLQLLAGQLCALMALFGTMPAQPSIQPEALGALRTAVRQVLEELMGVEEMP